jgi:hypothetical protein
MSDPNSITDAQLEDIMTRAIQKTLAQIPTQQQQLKKKQAPSALKPLILELNVCHGLQH